METHQIVLCSVPDMPKAKYLASDLVSHRLAACVNILPQVTSVYRWEGRVQTSDECLLVIKTAESHYSALEARIKEVHVYDVPEIIAFPVGQGLPAYLQWITDSITEG